MEATKIHKLIAEKNDRLERDALRQAESIIEEIAQQQKEISDATKRIAELRIKLKELNIEQLDTQALLGE